MHPPTLTVFVFFAGLTGCKQEASENPAAGWIKLAREQSRTLDRGVDLAGQHLKARTSGAWSCAAPRTGAEVECQGQDWHITWTLSSEASIKPVDTLIEAERWQDFNPKDPEGNGMWTLGKGALADHHGVFNYQSGRGESVVLFVGWHGDPGSRTRLSVEARGTGTPVDALSVMLTTTTS